MPNGRPGDNPLTDLIIHGNHPFPEDIEALLLRIDEIGRRAGPYPLGRYPLASNWPYSPLEFDWEKGEGLENARKLLHHFISMLEAGRGDEVMVDGLTQKPFSNAN